MSKKGKVEKETRKLIESISDLIKKKKGRFKFKSKSKKAVKKIRKSCVHWIFNKKITPTVEKDPDNPMNWRCKICNASFPIRPGTIEEYHEMTSKVIEVVNQMQFWSVKMGGDAEDTRLFIRLKNDLGRLKKVEKNILNQVNKRQQWEARKNQTDRMNQFDDCGGYSYRA